MKTAALSDESSKHDPLLQRKLFQFYSVKRLILAQPSKSRSDFILYAFSRITKIYLHVSPENSPSIDREMIYHHFNVNPNFSSAKQKRNIGLEKEKATENEVDKLGSRTRSSVSFSLFATMRCPFFTGRVPRSLMTKSSSRIASPCGSLHTSVSSSSKLPIWERNTTA